MYPALLFTESETPGQDLRLTLTYVDVRSNVLTFTMLQVHEIDTSQLLPMRVQNLTMT